MKKQYIISNIIIVMVLASLTLLTFSFYSPEMAFAPRGNDPYYQGNPSSQGVSLMINVYWGTEYIQPMLDVLADYEVRCTFFVGGSWVVSNGSLLQKIYDAGHEIGNHGYFHKDHKKLDYDKNRAEIANCGAIVQSTLGTSMTLFAPPSGAFSENTLKAAVELGYKVIMWSKDTIDWRDKDDNLVYTRATRNITSGDMILMHPTAHTLKALPRILDTYKSLSLTATTVSNLIA